jgi:hypothetical protein
VAYQQGTLRTFRLKFNKQSKDYYSEDVYKMASEPKELVIVPNADHVDLYDKTDLIPFDKLTSFFNENLK